MTYEEWKAQRGKTSVENGPKTESGQKHDRKVSYEEWRSRKGREAAERRKAEQSRQKAIRQADPVMARKQRAAEEQRKRQEQAAAGIEKFKADRAAAAQAEQDKPWWQKMAENTVEAEFDLLPGINIHGIARDFEKDTSWQEPDDRWDEESRRQFGLLYSQDPEQAKAYAADVNGFLDYLEKEEKRKALAQEAVDKPWLSTAKAIGAQALGGIGEYANDIAENLGRGRITERGTRLSPTEYAGAVTGAIRDDLNQKGVIDGSVYEQNLLDEQALRDTGIDPAVHRFATDVLGRQVLDGKGYGDLYELGTSAAQSLMWAPVAKIGGAAGQLASMVSYFGQAAASGVDDARARGGSDEQALWYGALMGLAEAGAEQINIKQLNALDNAASMRELLISMAKQGVGEGLEEGVTSVVGTLADELVMQDKSQRKLRILEYMADGMSEEEANRQAWTDAVNDALESVLGGMISGGMTGGTTTALKSGLTNFSYRNVAPDSVMALVQEGMAAPEGSAARTMAQEYEQQLYHGRELNGVQIQRLAQELWKQERASEQAGTQQEQEESPIVQPEATDVREELGTQEVTEEPVATDQDGLQVEEGFVSDTDVGDIGDDILAELSDLGLHEEEARVLRENFRDTNLDRSDYVTGVRTAFQFGQLGIPARELERRDSAASALAEHQRITAYKYGQLHGQQQAQAEQKALSGKSVAAFKNVDYEGDWNKLNNAQTAGIYAVNALGETLGIRYRFYESYQKGKQRMYLDENGVEKTAPNGFYKDGVIHLDVNAGSDGQGTVLFTAAHEMTHFIREWSPEKFRVLADTLMEGYAGQDTSVEQMISEKMAAYQKSGERLSFEQAFEEVVADSMETMLADGSFAERVQQLKQTDRTLWEKIRDWFVSMAEGIRKAYEGLTPDSREGQLVAEMVDTAERLKDLFAEAAVDAAGNLNGAEKNTAGEGGEVHSESVVKRSLRIVDQIQKSMTEIMALDNVYTIDSSNATPFAADLKTDEKVAHELFKSQGGFVDRPGFGKVILGKKGVVSTAFHGNGPAKQAALPAVKSVIEHGIEIGRDTNHKGKGFDTVTFAAPVDFFGVKSALGVVVKVSINGRGDKSFYIHEICDAEGNYIRLENGVLSKKEISSAGSVDPSSTAGAADDGISPTSSIRDNGGDVNTKFSLRTPVEQTKTLVAMHNLTTDKLMKAIDLGGFPMPSIAVTRTDIPHTNFGEITLVMDKSTVDPKANRKNTVYSADAWTPTFPRVEYEADSSVDDRVRKTLSQYESRIVPQFQSDLRKIKYGLEDLLNSQGGEQELIRHVMDNYGLKAAYLESQGKHVAEVQVEQEIPKKYSEAAIEKYESMIAVLGTRDPAELGTMPLKDIRDNYGPELEKIVPGISKTGMRLGRFIGQVVDYLMDDGSGPSTETVTDYAATRKAVDDALDNAGYESWVRELYAGIEKDKGIHNGKDRFTPSGRSRSFQQTHLSVTLDNIAKAMAAQNGGNTKNVAGFNGIKTLRAGTAERFKSIQAMHDREGRLKNLSQEEQDALTDELNSRLYDLIDEIDRETGKVGGSNNLMRFDLIGQILMEACETGSYNVADVQKVFRENHHEIGDGTALKVKELLFDVSQMPVNLFEAKPERAVRFDEVLAAVVPENAGEDLKAALKKTGVPVLEYADGNTQDRMRKVNSVEGARFSLRDPEHQAVQETLQQENEKLRKDVANLKELVKLQRTVTNGTKFTKTSVEAAAGLLMEKAGVSRGKQELVPILEKFYAFIARNDGYDWSDVAAETQEAVDWLLEHRKKDTGPDDYSREILDKVRSMRIRLNDTQAAEATSLYGSVNEYRKRMMGSVVISKDGTALDEAWQELADLYPGVFDGDVTDGDMPVKLAEIISSLRRNEAGEAAWRYEQEMLGQELVREVYDSYWQVNNMRTFADVKQKEIDRLKMKHFNQMDKLRTEHREKVAQLKAGHRDQIAAIRKEHREAMEKQARDASARYQESRKKASDSRHRTEMRHKIQKQVKKLNDLLLKEDKDHHVPESMKRAVADALDVVNMDTVGAQARIEELDRQIANARTEEKKQELMERRLNVSRMGGRMDARLASLKAAYETIRTEGDGYAYDEVIAGKIQETVEAVGNTALRDMNMEQLEAVHELYKAVFKSISTANKAFKAARGETITQLGSSVMEEVQSVGGSHKESLKLLEDVKSFGWNNLKPEYAMRAIGSGTLSELFRNVRAGEDTWAKDVSEAKAFYQERAARYGYRKWDLEETRTFASRNGLGFRLNLPQMMSLYAYSKREQADQHLQKGGFVFDTEAIRKEKKHGVTVEKLNQDATAYNLGPEELGAVVAALTKEQKAFVDEMQAYLSDTMGAKGNEVSMALYDIRLFKEKNYFPLKSARQFLFQQTENTGEVRLKNSGFSKKTTPKAGNPVILTGFMDVWANHVNDMSMYHAFVLPLEDFNRVFNYRTTNTEDTDSSSVKAVIQNAYGTQAERYIRQLLTDLNGGARVDPTTGFINKMMGKFKKGAVFASMSVVVQQPSAIGRAMAVIDPKYFGGEKIRPRGHKLLWEELKRYAPVALIKEMGYFDTNMGRSTVDYITAEEYSGLKEKVKGFFADSGYRDELLSALPALADEISWCYIWQSVKRETAAKHKGMDPGSEEFLKLAGKRFTEVITRTQVYDSVLSRSANMRSKDTGMKMATAFLAEPTTSINMVQDALLQAKRGDKKYARRAIGSVIASQILNACLVSFVYALRDDDEDESYGEKYMASFVGNVVESMNPLTYLPFVKDIVSIVQGYEVERTDMAVIGDLVNAWRKLGSDKLGPWEKVEQFAGALAQMFGIPLKNILRDTRAIWQTIQNTGSHMKTTGSGLKNAAIEGVTGSKGSQADRMYQAALDGDTEYVERLKGLYKDEAAARTAMTNAIRDALENEDITAEEATDHLERLTGRTEEESLNKVRYWQYKQQDPEGELNEGNIARYYGMIESSGISLDQYAEFLEKLPGNATKEETLRVINSMKLTRAQKDALYRAQGYAESTIGEAPWH